MWAEVSTIIKLRVFIFMPAKYEVAGAKNIGGKSWSSPSLARGTN